MLGQEGKSADSQLNSDELWSSSSKPSSKLRVCDIENGPVEIVDNYPLNMVFTNETWYLPIKNCDFPWFFLCLPEAIDCRDGIMDRPWKNMKKLARHGLELATDWSAIEFDRAMS
jgi:hypothetical protein